MSKDYVLLIVPLDVRLKAGAIIAVIDCSIVFSSTTVYNGRDLIRLFLGLDHLLYWIASQPQIFISTLEDLDHDAKKIVLFQLKMEIEEYYRKNYLTKDWAAICITEYGHDNYHDIKEIRLKDGQIITQIDIPGDFSHLTIIPGSKWEIMRFSNISNYSKVCIPGLCINCRSEQSFTVNILEYLRSIVSMLVDGSDGVITSNCYKCNEENQVLSLVVIFPWKILINLHPE